MTQEKDKKEEPKPKKIKFFIDKEHFETEQRELSVKVLLVEYAKEDPEAATLALKKGNDYEKFTRLDELIPMQNGMKFVVFHNEPTPVS